MNCSPAMNKKHILYFFIKHTDFMCCCYLDFHLASSLKNKLEGPCAIYLADVNWSYLLASVNTIYFIYLTTASQELKEEVAMHHASTSHSNKHVILPSFTAFVLSIAGYTGLYYRRTSDATCYRPTSSFPAIQTLISRTSQTGRTSTLYTTKQTTTTPTTTAPSPVTEPIPQATTTSGRGLRLTSTEPRISVSSTSTLSTSSSSQTISTTTASTTSTSSTTINPLLQREEIDQMRCICKCKASLTDIGNE